MDDSKKHHHHHRRAWWKWLLGVLLALVVVNGVVAAKFYFSAKDAVDKTYKKVSYKKKRTQDTISSGKPFSVLLLGTDTGEYGRSYQGRSDTIMVAAVASNKTTLVSIPRDTLVTIAGHSGNNKINAAYAYDGVSGALNTLQSYLDIPIDHYVEINMKGLEQLSAAVGSVTVYNDLDFTADGYHFAKGNVTINSKNILAYTRMRHQDSRGDYGRQLRQRMVIQAMVKKIASLYSLTKYQSILNAISSNMKTDLTFSDVKKIASSYSKATNIEQVQLKGSGQMIDGVSYEVVSQDALTKMQNTLKTALKIK